jgi:hypothetical protein
MADTGTPYVPYVPAPAPKRGPGYTIITTPSAPPAPRAPVYVTPDQTANQTYAAGAVVGIAQARAKKEALTKAQKRALKLAQRALKRGKYLSAAKNVSKVIARRFPITAAVLAGYTWLPAKWRKALEARVISAPKDYVDAYRWFGGVNPMRRPVMAPHTVSRSSKNYSKVLKVSKTFPVAPKPRVGGPSLARQAAGLARPRKVSKVSPIPKTILKAAPKISAGRMPTVPTAPVPRSAPASRTPTLRVPRSPPTLPPWLSPFLQAATLTSPRVPKLPLTPNIPASVASPFVGPSLSASPVFALAPQAAAQKCGCKRRKKRSCGSGHFKIGADGREKFTYWSKSKCQPSKLKSLSQRAPRTRTSSLARRSNMRVVARR